MATAGFCRGCGQYVWLNDQWGCVNGHPWTEITNWYDPSTGTPVTPYWLQPTPVAVAEAAPIAVAAPSSVAIAESMPMAAPTLDPAPNLEPAPAPSPMPSPIPEPSPQPEPIPSPIPEPAPWPAPEPAPGPQIEPLPQTGIDFAAVAQAPGVAQAATPAAMPAPAAPVAPAPDPPPAAAPSAVAPAPAQAPSARGDRLTLLADMLATFGQYPSYRAHYGTGTDAVIDNLIADANWGTGAKKVEFSAIMKAVEPEHTIHYWEMLKELSGGLNFGGFDAEMSTTSGMKRWGVTKEAVIGPGGVAMDYAWDYGATRRIVEDVAARHGWKVKTELQKKSAQW